MDNLTVVKLAVSGTRPMLMCSQEGVDPLHPLVREMKALNAKRTRKTEEDIIRISDIEMHLHFYHHRIIGPHIPALNFKRCLEDGAKTANKGKALREALETMAEIDIFPLFYGFGGDFDMPRDLETLIHDQRFRDTRSVRIGQASVMRVRPIFKGEWSFNGYFELDERQINFSDFQRFAYESGRRKGLGDYRPEFGRFEVVVTKGKDVDAEAERAAQVVRDSHAERDRLDREDAEAAARKANAG